MKIHLSVFVVVMILFGVVLAESAESKKSKDAENVDGAPHISKPKIKYTESKYNDPVFKIPIHIRQASTHLKKTMVLVHGFGQVASQDWNEIADLYSKDYRLLVFDLPGFGQSQGKLQEFVNPRTYADLVARLVKKYAKGKVVLVGHSMGGAVSLSFLHRYPELVDKAVLIGAAGILQQTVYTKQLATQKTNKPESSNSVSGVFRDVTKPFTDVVTKLGVDFVDKFSGLKDLLWKHPSLKKAVFGGQTATQAAIGLVETDFSEAIAEIKTPILLMWGADDQVAPSRVGQLLHFHLKNSDLMLFPGLGHSPHREQPGKIYGPSMKWIANPTFAKVELPDVGTRVFNCKGQSTPKLLTGSYAEMTFEACRNVVLSKLSASKISFKNTTATLENVKVVSKGVALDLRDSNIRVTNLIVNADIGINVFESKLDIAGATILYRDKPLTGASGAVYWTTSRLQKEYEKPRFKHGKSILKRNSKK